MDTNKKRNTLAGITRLVVVVLVTMVVAGAFFSSIKAVFTGADVLSRKQDQAGEKRYTRLVAEGVRYRDYTNIGVDQFSFKSCRLEKRRKGAITFGAFNVLVMEELVLNIPVSASHPRGQEMNVDSTVATENTMKWLKDNYNERILPIKGLSNERFSGVRISGLTVNRCVSNRLDFVFYAEKAESQIGSKALHLRGCVIGNASGQGYERVDKAKLVLEPSPRVIYQKGDKNEYIELPGI